MKITIRILLSLMLLLVVVFFIFRQPDRELDELKTKYTNEASQFIEIDGISTHYRKEGNGPVLLLLHGTSASLHTWDRWAEILKKDFTVVRLDLPAFGLTGPHPNRNYTLGFYSNFLKDFTQKLGIDSLFIAGNSLGGAIAWKYTINHPNQVKELIIIDGAGFPLKEMPQIFKLAKNPIGAFFIKQFTPRSFIEKNIIEVYAQDELITDSLVDRYYELTLRAGNRQAFIDRAKLGLNNQSEEIKKINCPTLILWGKQDAWIPVSDAYKFEKAIDGSELIVYDNVGHVPMEERPTSTANDAKKFLLNNH